MFIMTEQNLNLAQDCFVYPMNQKKRSGSCACVVVVGSQSSGSTHAQDYTGFLFTNILPINKNSIENKAIAIKNLIISDIYVSKS